MTQDETRWISVEDELPEKGERTLYTDGYSILWGQFGGEVGDMRIADGYWWSLCALKLTPTAIDTVTHWMPIPEPPEVDDG